MIVTPISLFSNNYFPNIVTRPVVEWKLVSTNKITLSKKTGTMVGQHACHESQGQPEGHAIAMEGRTFLKSSYENRKKEDVLLQEVEASEHKINLS